LCDFLWLDVEIFLGFIELIYLRDGLFGPFFKTFFVLIAIAE